jgi:hypothetical protein
MSQVLVKLFKYIADCTWKSHSIGIITDILKFLLTVDDGEDKGRLETLLLFPRFGLAKVILSEK